MARDLACLAGDALAHPYVALPRHPCLEKPLQDKPNLHPLFNRSDLARSVQKQNQETRKKSVLISSALALSLLLTYPQKMRINAV